MRPTQFIAVDTAVAARQAASRAGGSNAANTPATVAEHQYLAGGTTLLDLMKLDVMRPRLLVDINSLKPKRDSRGGIEAGSDGIRFSAFARMAKAAEHPAVQRDYPLIGETLKLAASAQLRNMASLGGNALHVFSRPALAGLQQARPRLGLRRDRRPDTKLRSVMQGLVHSARNGRLRRRRFLYN